MTTFGEADEIPADCALALKEWASICDALYQGRQSILIRKGGIVEGPRGFVPEYSHFWLYATHFHQNHGGAPESHRNLVELPALAGIAGAAWIDSFDDLAGLRDLHEWDEESLRKRFFYRQPGVWVLAVRIRARPEPFRIPDLPEYRGCVGWVPLDRPYPTDGLRTVLDDDAFARILGRLPINRTPTF